jgi:hypothetical protein
MSKDLVQVIYVSIGVITLAAFGLIGCNFDSSQTDAMGSGNAGPNHPPIIRSVTIAPVPIVREGVVTATVDAEDLDRDALTFTFTWIVNDEPRLEEVSPILHPERLNLGDRVTVEAIPHDGKVAGPPVRSQSVVVGNTQPVIRALTIQPGNAKVGDRLVATVEGSDIDGEEIRYTYRWSQNNQVVAEGDQGMLDTTGFARGDVITVSATPHDRGSHGKEHQSELLTLLNSPPKFTSSAPGVLAQGHYSYVVSAVDPENDPLTFALESAPSGMTIDEKAGRIQWKVPVAPAGVYKVKILVKDDHQGWASQEIDVTIGNSVTAKREGP